MRNNIIQEFLAKIPPEEMAEIEKQIEVDTAYHDNLVKEGKIFGTPTSITLEIVREEGFNPIGICHYGGEETFLFSTKKEANSAYKKLEKDSQRIYAWWYSKRSFLKEIEEVEYKPSKIHWL